MGCWVVVTIFMVLQTLIFFFILTSLNIAFVVSQPWITAMSISAFEEFRAMTSLCNYWPYFYFC